MQVTDKVVVVTGAGSGIGRAMSEKFVAEGAKQVVAVDINAENAQQTARQAGLRSHDRRRLSRRTTSNASLRTRKPTLAPSTCSAATPVWAWVGANSHPTRNGK